MGTRLKDSLFPSPELSVKGMGVSVEYFGLCSNLVFSVFYKICSVFLVVLTTLIAKWKLVLAKTKMVNTEPSLLIRSVKAYD